MRGLQDVSSSKGDGFDSDLNSCWPMLITASHYGALISIPTPENQPVAAAKGEQRP